MCPFSLFVFPFFASKIPAMLPSLLHLLHATPGSLCPLTLLPSPHPFPPSSPLSLRSQTLHIFVRFSVTRMLVFVQLGILYISVQRIHRAPISAHSRRDRMLGRLTDVCAHQQREYPQELEIQEPVCLFLFNLFDPPALSELKQRQCVETTYQE